MECLSIAGLPQHFARFAKYSSGLIVKPVWKNTIYFFYENNTTKKRLVLNHQLGGGGETPDFKGSWEGFFGGFEVYNFVIWGGGVRNFWQEFFG